MIQLMTQPIPVAPEGGNRPVADSRAPDVTRDVASVAGFHLQVAEPEALGKAITVQSFLAQFDTAQAVDASAQPVDSVRPAPAQEPPADTAEPVPAAQQQAEPSPSGAESWLAGMLSQAGLVVQARDNLPARTSAAVAGFATQSVDARAQVPLATAPMNSATPLPIDTAEGRSVASEPAPREATQSQAQALLQQHLATAADTSGVQDAATPPLPAVALDTRLPAADRNLQPAAAPPLPDKPLHLKDSDAHWGEQMVTALRDNVELQLGQRVQNATIRLDPPELGSLEILVRHEAGQLNVQISASHGDVVRMLQQTSDRLRQELVGQNFLQVNVQVSADAQSGQGGQQGRQRFGQEQVAVAANPRDAQAGGRAATRGDSDVLITV